MLTRRALTPSRPIRSALLKYHRGVFFGFRVEIKGWWWCPYTVWHPPETPDENPIVRHASKPKMLPAGADPDSRLNARRNTCLAQKLARPALRITDRTTGRSGIKQLWRGESFYSPVLGRASRLGGLFRRSKMATAPPAGRDGAPRRRWDPRGRGQGPVMPPPMASPSPSHSQRSPRPPPGTLTPPRRRSPHLDEESGLRDRAFGHAEDPSVRRKPSPSNLQAWRAPVVV